MYGRKLRELRKIEGWTQEEVAKKIGVSKQTYSHYENEQRKPSLETIRELAAVYQVNIDDIFSTEERATTQGVLDKKTGELVNLPIVGAISCRNDLPVFEKIVGYEPTPEGWLNGGEYFYLRAGGDFMISARIHNGDLVLIRQQPEVENGQIAAVLLHGKNILLKRIYSNNGQLILQSENLAYEPIFAPPSEARIIGRAVRVIAML